MIPYNASDMIRAMETQYGLTQLETPKRSVVSRFGQAFSTLLRRSTRR